MSNLDLFVSKRGGFSAERATWASTRSNPHRTSLFPDWDSRRRRRRAVCKHDTSYGNVPVTCDSKPSLSNPQVAGSTYRCFICHSNSLFSDIKWPMVKGPVGLWIPRVSIVLHIHWHVCLRLGITLKIAFYAYQQYLPIIVPIIELYNVRERKLRS